MNRIVKELRQRQRKDFGPSAILATPIAGTEAFAYSDPNANMIHGSASDAEMAIDFVAITDIIDREGDTVTPESIRKHLADYAANPAWLFEHNALEQIAICRDPSGVCTVRIEPRRVVVRPHYNRLTLRGERLSEEFYRLAKAGLFMGASVGFLPIDMEKRGYGRGDGYNYQTIRVTEFSQTSQPVNQEALRRCLSRGIVKSLGLKHRLETMLVKPKPVVNGATLEKSMSKLKTGAIEFDTEVYSPTQAEKYLAVNGYTDFNDRNEFPGCITYGRKSIKLIPGSRQTLGKGVTALKGKAFGNDEDDDEIDDETPAAESEEETETPAAETDETPEEPVVDDAIDDVPEVEDDVDETGEDDAKATAEFQSLAEAMAHFKLFVDNHPEMDAAATHGKDALAKAAQAAQKAVDSISAVIGKHYVNAAVNAATSMPADVAPPPVDAPADVPVDDVPTGDMDEDEILKALTGAVTRAKSVRVGVTGIRKALPAKAR